MESTEREEEPSTNERDPLGLIFAVVVATAVVVERGNGDGHGGACHMQTKVTTNESDM